MTRYTVNLPYVDPHEQCENFVDSVLALSNRTSDDGRPQYVTDCLVKAIEIARTCYILCLRYGIATELNVKIVPMEVSV